MMMMIVMIVIFWPSSETQGQIVGPKTKIKTGGKKFDEQKYERKIRAPGDKLFTHQFQTAERIQAPDWAENIRSEYSFGRILAPDPFGTGV